MIFVEMNEIRLTFWLSLCSGAGVYDEETSFSYLIGLFEGETKNLQKCLEDSRPVFGSWCLVYIVL